jgi:hypothetical protein
VRELLRSHRKGPGLHFFTTTTTNKTYYYYCPTFYHHHWLAGHHHHRMAAAAVKRCELQLFAFRMQCSYHHTDPLTRVRQVCVVISAAVNSIDSSLAYHWDSVQYLCNTKCCLIHRDLCWLELTTTTYYCHNVIISTEIALCGCIACASNETECDPDCLVCC